MAKVEAEGIQSKSRSSANKKRRHSDGDDLASSAREALLNGPSSSSHAARRSSLTKPGRDKLDEPEGKRPKRHRRKQDDRDSRATSPVIDFDGLSRPSVGTRARLEESPEEKADRLERMKGLCGHCWNALERIPTEKGSSPPLIDMRMPSWTSRWATSRT
uniref:Uncharacterized protein n=1 Tax=Bionectria ochroleuca TaxID=29856 RepID=A0A8H7NLL3_BIOOC